MSNKIYKNFFVPSALICCLTALSSCNKTSTYVVPTFDEGTTIDILAYCPSSPAKKASGTNVNTVTEENYKNIAKAGFTHALSLREGFFGEKPRDLDKVIENGLKTVEEECGQCLDLCQKYGLKYYVKDWNLYALGTYSSYHDNELEKYGIDTYEEYKECIKKIIPDDCKYVKHPAYAGNYLYDEFWISELKAAGEVVQAYLERMNELGIENAKPIVNLLPAHAGSSGIGNKGWENYVDTYYAYVGKKTKSISYDCYPFMGGKIPYIKDLYLYNLQLAANRCKDYECSLETYVQAEGDFTGMRDMENVGDFRLQVYSDLAFGSRSITYYQYGKPKANEETGSYGIMDIETGKLNDTYEYAKTVNNEIKDLQKAITCYRYDNILTKSVDPEYVNNNFDNLDEHITKHDRVEIKSVTQDTYMTTMKRKTDNSDAFMLVNFADPYYEESDTVTLKFNNTKAIMFYKLGEWHIEPLTNGEFTFELQPGEGDFIIPLN